MFYGTAAWELVPEAWRCVSACRAAGQAIGRDTFCILGRAVVERMERALRARDRLHEQFQVPQNHDTADEALFYLDMLLVQLSGAFDALARVAHLGFGLPGSHREASWRHPGWRDRLARQAPMLAALMTDQTEERDALELVALLRNSVHGEPFTPVTRRRAGQTDKLIQLPQDDTPRFLAAVGRRGGDTAWGIHSVAATPGGIMMEADTYVEALLPTVARSLNALMRATEVERFPGSHTAGSPHPGLPTPRNPRSERQCVYWRDCRSQCSSPRDNDPAWLSLPSGGTRPRRCAPATRCPTRASGCHRAGPRRSESARSDTINTACHETTERRR